MKRYLWRKFIDTRRYRRLLFRPFDEWLALQDPPVQEDLIRRHPKKQRENQGDGFCPSDCCSLEIEFGVNYERSSRSYIRHGIRMLKAAVGYSGRFAPGTTMNDDISIDIILDPMGKPELEAMFTTIRDILQFYDNIHDDKQHGVRAHFQVNEEEKRRLYDYLIYHYDSSRSVRSTQSMGFHDIVLGGEGTHLSYEEYIDYQKRVCGQYVDVNFLGEGTVEFRTIDLNWADIEYIIDIVEQGKHLSEKQEQMDSLAV